MNGELAQYLFLPWFRQGLATRITGPSSQTPQRAGFTVSLQVEQKINERIQKQAELYGPSDVTGFNPRVVVRTDPKPHIGDFEPNYFPLIEFSEPDFPWRYTPLPVAENQPQLKPWICLIVLRAEPGASGEQVEFEFLGRAGDQLPPAIRVRSPKNSLPHLGQIWAWAHVQMTAGGEELDALRGDGQAINIEQLQVRLREIQGSEPERLVSRLLCPRQLKAGVLYHAFVVPTFESGRRAGLGNNLVDIAIDDDAWDSSEDARVDLPYYFDWEFRTGLRGDFEYLVRLLEPRELDRDSGVGMRDMDCSSPGYDLPSVERADKPEDDPKRHVLALEGALWTVDAEPDPPLDQEDGLGGFANAFTQLLNRPEEQLETGQDDYLITPPIYGRWHAARKKLLAPNRAWLNELNVDPRQRAAAGFGTLIVQDQQEKLMAEAWRQIGAVNEANELLRQAQLGRAGSERVHRRHLQRLPRADLIRLTEPLHARVTIDVPQRNGDSTRVTVRQLLRESRIPSAVLEPAFRRIARSRGPLRRRQHTDADPGRPDILERLNDGSVAAAGPVPSPGGAPGMGDISDSRRPGWAKGALWLLLKRLHWVLAILVLLLYVVIGLLSASGASVAPTHPLVVAASVLLVIAALIARLFITPGLIADNVREEEMTPERVRSAPGRPDFVFEPDPGSDFTPASVGGQDSEAARVFREFAIAVQAFLSPTGAAEVEPGSTDLGRVRGTLIEALDPRRTILARTRRRLTIGDVLRGPDRLETIMAAPEFHQPMYEPLRDRSQELLLPGVGNIHQNTIALLKTNRRFVESHLLGLNHEMARELLWREYPTDQRGSYFRQFWDVSSFVPPASMLEDLEQEAIRTAGESWDSLLAEEQQAKKSELLREWLKDIRPLHNWWDAELGENSGRRSETLKEKLVLLIRGDLLKKYPTAVIYASKAKWDEIRGTRWPSFEQGEENRRESVLAGTLPPDITFLGFDLDKDEARGTLGSPGPGNQNLGWFFVIEERISETRFGMDVEPTDPEEHVFDRWDQLSWADLPEDNGLHSSGYVNVAAGPVPTSNPDDYSWDSDAAIIARITVQKPVRVAVHAERMLPDS